MDKGIGRYLCIGRRAETRVHAIARLLPFNGSTNRHYQLPGRAEKPQVTLPVMKPTHADEQIPNIVASNGSRYILSRVKGSSSLAVFLLTASLATAQSQVPEDASTGIPKFYSQSRQILVAATVWDSSRTDTSWIPQDVLKKDPATQRVFTMHPPVQGLTAKSFHVFDKGNAVIPIGLKLDTETLKKGDYRVEVQASDSAGHQTEWRQAEFTIE